MPIHRDKVLAGSQMTGLLDAGLFARGFTGADIIKVRCNNILFHTTVRPTTVLLELVDPTDPDNAVELKGRACKNITITNYPLPTEADGTAWSLRLTTTGATADLFFTVDYNDQPTER